MTRCHGLRPALEEVVRHDRADGDGEAARGRDERLTHPARDGCRLIESGLGHDAERPDHAGHCPEQAEERASVMTVSSKGR